MKKYYVTNKLRYPGIRNLVLILISAAFLVAVIFFIQIPENISPKFSFAEEIEKCAAISSNAAKVECYDSAVKNYLGSNSTDSLISAFETAMDEKGEIRRDCHRVAHAIGRAAYAKIGNLAEVFELDRKAEICAGGIFHGAIEALFRPEGGLSSEHIARGEFAEKVPTLCGKFSSSRRRSECAHGIGHGALYLIYNLDEALGVCDMLSEDTNNFSCYSGVFMEYFISGRSVSDDVSDPHFPCDNYKSKYRNPCYYVLSFRFEDLGIAKAEAVKKCREAESPGGAFCVRGYGIFYLAHEVLADGYDSVIQFCESLDRANARVCAESVASRLAAHSQNGEYAMPFCASFSSRYLSGRCFAYTADVLRVGYDMDPKEIENECRRRLEKPELCIESI